MSATALVLFTGCDAGAPAPPPASSTTRDSAGISIIESPVPALPPGSWTVAAEPSVSCSGAGPPGNEPIDQVMSAVPLESGGLAILTLRGPHIHICEGGRLVRSFGQPGEGPGEIPGRASSASLMPVAGDSVAVIGLERVTVFAAATGGFREVTRPGDPALGDASAPFFPAPPLFAATHHPVSTPGGTPRMARGYRVMSWSGPEVDTIVGVPPDPQRGVGVVPFLSRLWPRATDPLVLSAQGAWVWESEAFELRRFGPRGLEGIVRTASLGRPVTDAMREMGLELLLEESLELQPDRDIAALRASLMRSVEADTSGAIPAILRVFVATTGELWVRMPEDSPRRDPSLWRVIDAERGWLTDVTMPPSFFPRFFDGGSIVGLTVDSLDLVTVERRPIQRSR